MEIVFRSGEEYAKHFPLVVAGTLALWFALAGLLWKFWAGREDLSGDDGVTVFFRMLVVPALVGIFAVSTVATVSNLRDAYRRCARETSAFAWRADGCDHLPGTHEPASIVVP